MSEITRLADKFELLTFDCYGTLIDWEAGIRSSLASLGVPEEQRCQVVAAYVRTEAAVEQQGYRSYREVQAATLELLARDFDFGLPDDRRHALSHDLPGWRPFPDTNAALERLRSKYRLGILSNIDRDLLAATCAHLDVDFDTVITAEDVHSYKPAHPHFLRVIQQVGDRNRVLHVAQSLYHDGVPASELGLHYVWINRYGNQAARNVPMLAEFADLAGLADALGV
jgi:2-haloalkanoic acid dehalogenase type II